MLVIAILSIGVSVGAIAIWIGLIWGLRKAGWRYWIGAIAVQLSVVLVLISILRGASILGAAFNALAALIALWSLLSLAHEFLPFLGPLIAWSLLVAAGVTLILWPVAIGPWRLLPAALFGLGSLLVMAEFQSRAEMCAASQSPMIHRHSFLWSLRNTPAEFAWGYHAWQNGLAWSYRERAWVRLPPNPNLNPPEAKYICWP